MEVDEITITEDTQITYIANNDEQEIITTPPPIIPTNSYKTFNYKVPNENEIYIDPDNGLQVPLNPKISYKNWHIDYPIIVKRHPTNGRYLISTSSLLNNTVLLKDLPYTWAVDHCAYNYVCQQCFLEIPLELQSSDSIPFIVCEGCERVGYCSERCQQIDSHQHKLECPIIAKLDTIEYSTSLLSEIKLLVRTLSRKWLEMELDQDATKSSDYYSLYHDDISHVPQDNGLRYDDYIELVSNVESFADSLKESLTYWICNYIVKLAKEEVNRKEDEADLLAILLRNRCNAFYIQGRPREGGNGESRGCGVYVRNSFFNHSCDPNVNYWVVNNSLEVECSLIRDVQEGEELTISYIDTTGTLSERRDKLLDGYLFECQCKKCKLDEYNIENGILTDSETATISTDDQETQQQNEDDTTNSNNNNNNNNNDNTEVILETLEKSSSKSLKQKKKKQKLNGTISNDN